MPWAARRALDLAGRKLSLAAWRAMPEAERRRLARLGLETSVDGDATRALAPSASPIDIFSPPEDPPQELARDPEAWNALSCVARHALHAYARRGNSGRLRIAYDTLTSSGRSQSTR